MIFGIKSKKDKKIEELQKEIERLKQVPLFDYEISNIIKYYADFLVPIEKDKYLPDDYVARNLMGKIADEIVNNDELIISYEDDPVTLMRCYRARLNIVKK